MQISQNNEKKAEKLAEIKVQELRQEEKLEELKKREIDEREDSFMKQGQAYVRKIDVSSLPAELRDHIDPNVEFISEIVLIAAGQQLHFFLEWMSIATKLKNKINAHKFKMKSYQSDSKKYHELDYEVGFNTMSFNSWMGAAQAAEKTYQSMLNSLA